MIESEYYSFLMRGDVCFGKFQLSAENPRSYKVNLYKLVGLPIERTSFTHQIAGMEELYDCGEIVHVDVKILKTDIYIVSKYYFLQNVMPPFQIGMTGLYVVNDEIEKYPPSNLHLGATSLEKLSLIKCNFFIDIQYKKVIGRFNLQEAFVNSLSKSKGQGTSASFSLDQVSIEFVDFLFSGIKDASSYVTLKRSTRTKSILKSDSILHEVLARDEIILQCPSVEWLIPFFGVSFYYFPIVNSKKRTVGTLDHERFAFIKIHDSEIIFKFDINSHRLFVSYALKQGTKDEATKGLQSYRDDLARERDRLHGRVITTSEGDFRVCLVEYNSFNFTQSKNKNKYTSTLVAWAMDIADYVEECDPDNCLSFDPKSISDDDVHEVTEHSIKKNKASGDQRTKLNSSFLLNIDQDGLSTEGCFVFVELNKHKEDITIDILFRTLDCFTFSTIKRILIDEMKLINNIQSKSKKDLMCLCQYILNQ